MPDVPTRVENLTLAEVTFTFDGGEIKTLIMSVRDYTNLKVQITSNRKAGLEPIFVLAIVGEGGVEGEFALPVGKLLYWEAFLRPAEAPMPVAQGIGDPALALTTS